MGIIKKLMATKPEADIKLPKKFKQKWVAALSDGSYAQTNGILAEENVGYCCLGVAASICEVGLSHLLTSHMLDGLPDNLQARLPKTFTSDEGCKVQNQLASFNDGSKCDGNKEGNSYNFKQIAKWIDKYL